MAADQGYSSAQKNYAGMLYIGKGGDVELKEARRYYKMAADQGYIDAQNNYAVMLTEMRKDLSSLGKL